MESFCRDTLNDASYIPKNLEQKAGLHLPKATNIVFQKKIFCMPLEDLYMFAQENQRIKKEMYKCTSLLVSLLPPFWGGLGWGLVSVSVWFKRTFYSYANIICLVLI